MYDTYLYHHGILKQRWGVRHGPPYPLKGGSYSPAQKKEIYKQKKRGNSIYNKKHFDEVLRKDKTTLSTLSYDPNRTKNTEMFYATHKALDKHQYNALFNKKVPLPVYDKNGKEIGTAELYKWKINNKLKKDIKVASEDSAANVFKNLYSNDRDFYNFVTDEDRMQKYFVDDKFKFKGYRESRAALEKIRDGKTPSEEDVQRAYRMFNYVIPYDGGGDDARGGKDVSTQRAKFFKAMGDAGYGAVLDTNDAIYGAFKATSPVIVFDVGSCIPDSVMKTTSLSKKFSALALAGRKILHV